MTQISPGCTYIGPNSVKISNAPCWGTIIKSPSELTMAFRSMLALHRYVWTARPSRSVGSPEPAILLRPETKSILPSVGVSKGSHASCVGETWTRLLTGRKFDSVSSLSGRSVCKYMSAYETSDRGTDQILSLVFTRYYCALRTYRCDQERSDVRLVSEGHNIGVRAKPKLTNP